MPRISQYIILALFAVAVIFNAGCTSAQPTRAAGLDELPNNWFTLSKTSWKYQTLPYGISSSIDDIRTDMTSEEQSTAYRFYNRYSNGLKAKMASVSLSADSAFLASFAAISKNLSPEMKGLGNTHNDFQRDRSVVMNANLRMLVDDWNRLWLWDSPSQLSSFDTISTTGIGP
jgi:hypothetical protein